ncbi:MAG: adenylate/guanylate cyclase domain-containing protein [Acetobacteraceae bacterium]
MPRPPVGDNLGERKVLTVLFADVRGSLSLISGRDPEQADELLSEATGAMVNAIGRHSGTIARVMGDGIMALFGAPQSIEHHAASACMAALEIRRTVTEERHALADSLGASISVRIGLNSGEAVVKRITSSTFVGYEANGEVVHVASRMEQMAPENAILMTAETARLASPFFDLHSLGPHDVKGLDKPVALFELAGERARVARSPPVGGEDFIARAREWTAIAEARRLAAGGEGGVVLIRGDAGLGKSRLVSETVMRRPGGCLVASAQALPFQRRGYQLVADLVASCLGLETMNARTIDPVSLQASLAALGVSTLFSPLAVVLGLNAPGADWAAVTPAERRVQMRDAVCTLFERLALRRTLILVAEDLHWIDLESQDLLDLLVGRIPKLPILLVATSRPEWRCRWKPGPWLTELQLSPLSEKALGELLARRLEGNGVEPRAMALARRAGGNPLFAEVMLGGLADRGVLLDTGTRFHILREAPLDHLPATIRGQLSERIDRLPASEKHILQVAAVIGVKTSIALLANVAGVKPDALDVLLDRLRIAGFFEENSTPEPTLVFRHELMREAVSAGLLQRTRRDIHSRVVDAMHGLNTDRLDMFVEELAEHARDAYRWAEAAHYARLAGQKAMARGANAEAAYFLDSALGSVEHWPEGDDRRATALDLHLAIRDPLFRLGRMDELASHLAQAAPLLSDDTDWRKHGLFHVQSSHLLSLRGDSGGALAECSKALALAERHSDAALAARARFQEGFELFLAWEFTRAVPALEDVWRHVSANPNDNSYGLQRGFDITARSYATRAWAELGHFEQAELAANELLAMAEARGRTFDSFFAYIAKGHLHEARDEPLIAKPWLERAEASCRSADMPLLAVVAASHLGLVMARSGDTAGGLERLQAAHGRIVTMGFRFQLAFCVASLAEAYLLAGNLAEARSAAEQAATNQHDAGARAQALLVLAECLRVKEGDDPDAGSVPLAEARDIAERLLLGPLARRCAKRIRLPT